MSRLSHEARALIHRARPEEEPGAGQRDRVRRRLVRKLGYAALATAAVPSAAGASTGGAVGLGAGATATWAKVLIAAGVIGTTAAAGVRVNVERPPLAAPIVANAPERVGNAVDQRSALDRVNAPEATAPEAAPQRTATPRAPARPQQVAAKGLPRSPAPSKHDLDQELDLLQGAQQELNEGRPARALELLDEHEHTHGSGMLREERLAARVLALCEMGRLKEGRAAAEQFLREAPSSVFSARVRAACAAK